jgi:hypothetical protein
MEEVAPTSAPDEAIEPQAQVAISRYGSNQLTPADVDRPPRLQDLFEQHSEGLALTIYLSDRRVKLPPQTRKELHQQRSEYYKRQRAAE